jgi:hypothetical protein
VPPIFVAPPLYEPPTPPPSSHVPPPPPPPPPHPFSKPPITRFFQRRNKTLTELPSSPTTSASPDAPAVDDSNNINESHIVSGESQAGPRYNLQDRSTIHPEEKYGFPRVNALVHEPVTYQEAANIPE